MQLGRISLNAGGGRKTGWGTLELQIYFREREDVNPEQLLSCFGGGLGCPPNRAAMDLVEALAEGMMGLSRAQSDSDLGRLCDSARHLEHTAAAGGLRLLLRAARNVQDCAATDDPIAIAATVARCRRLGDAVITSIWTSDQGRGDTT